MSVFSECSAVCFITMKVAARYIVTVELTDMIIMTTIIAINVMTGMFTCA